MAIHVVERIKNQGKMKSNFPKVSIITPIYNANKHLHKCLDTLVNQTLQEIEIILVLDSPTDGSDIIAKQYAAKDNRIVIVENTHNLHIGLARNEGLKVAQAEYIGFSDHDDYRELSMYEKLYTKAKKEDADIVLSLPTEIHDGIKKNYDCGDIQNDFSKETLLSDLIGFGNNNHSDGAYFVNIHNNIYKKDILLLHNISFVDTKIISPEDVLFQIQSIFFSKKTVLLREAFYYHINNTNNEGSKYSYISYWKRSEGIQYIYDFLKKNSLFEQYKTYFYTGVCRQFINCLSAAIFNTHLCEYFKARRHLRSYVFCKPAFANYNLIQSNKHLPNRLFRQFLVLSLK